MKKTSTIYTVVFVLTFLISAFEKSYAQLPCNVLVGYYQTSWGDRVRLANINDKYNVICLSFLEAGGGDGNGSNNTINDLSFYHYRDSELRQDIPIVQAKGKKVIFSIGGANGSFSLDTDADIATFVTKTKNYISSYGVDGIDIDLEHSMYLTQTGTINAPSIKIANLIKGIKQLLTWYQSTYNKKMILTLVPETAYVTGGLSAGLTNAYGVAYLPIIEALRDDIDLVMMQLYNAGANVGLDGKSYNDGTIDFIVSQTEAVIRGFTCANNRGVYSGIPASKVTVALPATKNAASTGYVDPYDVFDAVDYLRGIGPRPGSYKLLQQGGYPELRGMTTWSVNITKNAGDEFAENFSEIFNECLSTSVDDELITSNLNKVYPNPTNGLFFIERKKTSPETLKISNSLGQMLIEQKLTELVSTIDISILTSGLYLVEIEGKTSKLIVE